MPTQVDEATWKAKLNDMAQRNTPLELSPSPDGVSLDRPPFFRVRMLHMNDEAIFVEYPTSPDAIKLFRPEDEVRLHTGTAEMRWEIELIIIGRVKLRLNASKQIPALKLTMPKSVSSGQRRDYFRAPTAAMDIKSVVLFPLESRDSDPPRGELRAFYKQWLENGEQGDAPNNAPRPFLGRLLNISGAGIGVAITDQDAVRLAPNQWFWVQIDLPTSDEPIYGFALAVRLDQQTPDVFHLGMSLEWPDPLAAKESAESVIRFTTWVQRMQLQKRREG